jgi:N-acetylmuramoyl-L-alanine amidase
MRVLIDNGHGENTPGKRSPDGRLRECLYAREMADRVVAGLRRLGIEAERIVKESVDVALKERVRRVNEVCRELGTANVLLVSIHCNAAGNGQEWMKARGWSAYTTKGVTKADRLADCLYEEAEREFEGLRIRKDMSDGDPDWEENFYILKNTKCPAVLTENFFQDNEEDVAYLLSDEGKQAVTETHVKGIARYIDTLK